MEEVDQVDKTVAASTPFVYIEDANPDVFHDIPVRCLASGLTPGEVYVSVTVSHGPVGSPTKPCGWHNVLLVQNGDSYEQLLFDHSVKVTIGPDGRAQFGVKFLSLSKDGLLPQFPMRISISRDKLVKDIVVSSQPFRIISFKVLVKPLPEENVTVNTRVEVSIVDVHGKSLEVPAKLDLSLYSTTDEQSAGVSFVDWRKEAMAWTYENGAQITDGCVLPAVVCIRSTTVVGARAGYTVRASVLSLSGTTVSLTKVGRGVSPCFHHLRSQSSSSRPAPIAVNSDETADTNEISPTLSTAHPPQEYARSPAAVMPSLLPQELTAKSPQDTFRHFAQLAMRALHSAYTASTPEEFSIGTLNEAYDMYQKMDIPGCLAQLKNPPIVKNEVPPSKPPISLKSFPIPGSKKHVVSTPCNNDSSVTLSSRAAATPQLPAFTYQAKPYKPSTEQSNKPAQVSQVNAQHQHVGANGNGAQPYHGGGTNVYMQDRQGAPDAQAAFINRLYVSHAGVYAGFPIHKADHQLLGFYEESPDGLKFVNKQVPLEIRQFLETFCSHESKNIKNFYNVESNGLGQVKAEIIKGLAQKKYYHFP